MSAGARTDLELDRFPFRGADVVGVGAELDGEVECDALHGGGEREDGERFSEFASGEPMNAGTAGFDRVGDRAEPRGCGPAAVEADKCVVRAECECRPVAELLER